MEYSPEFGIISRSGKSTVFKLIDSCFLLITFRPIEDSTVPHKVLVVVQDR